MAKRYVRWVPSIPTIKRIGRVHTALYRATRGVLGGRIDGLDVLLLTTRGRRSGQLRTNPIPFFRDGADLVLIGSFGGGAHDPAWVWNLRADPKAAVQVRGRSAEVEARLAEGAERARIWQAVCADHPRYVEYQKRTEREMPVVVLPGAASLVAP